MNWPRAVAALLALALHAGIFYALFSHERPDTLADGSGLDNFTVVASVSLESADLFSQDASKAAQDVTTAKEEPRQTPKEDKPEKSQKEAELADKPEQAQEQEKPPEKQQKRAQTASLAAPDLDAQRAAAALASHRNQIWSAYQIELHTALERHKLKPHSNKMGEVLVEITIAPSGQLLSHFVRQTSGVPELDRAAITSLERASPFPPIPQEISSSPLSLTVPFRYRTQ